MAERFERHSLTFTLLTLVSRATGLARDAALARVFGAGALMDAFNFGFIIPNLFRRLFGEGAMSASFLRVYAQIERSDPLAARKLATLNVGFLVAVLGGVTLLGEAVLWLLSQRAGEGGLLTLRLTMIMLPFMPLVCLTAFLGAMLQVHGRFGPSASVPIVLNVCVVAAAVGLGGFFGEDRASHIAAVAKAVIAAGIIQVAWMLWALRGDRWLVRGASEARSHLGEVLRQAGPMILGLGAIQINTFVDGVIASYPTTIGPTIFGVAYPLKEGALASLGYAQRLYEFPLGVFGIAVATAIFPALARQAADAEAFAVILRRGLRLVVFIGLPASAGLMLVGPALVDVIYKGGEFGATSADRVWRCLMGYAPAVWAYSMTHVVTRAFYARNDAFTPLRLAVAMVGLNFLLNVTLIWTPLRESGLAWSTSACAIIQAAVLLRLMRKQAGAILDREVRAGWARSAAVTAVMVVTVLLVIRVLPAASTWRESLLNLLAPVAAGGAVFAAAARALRMPELRWTLGRA